MVLLHGGIVELLQKGLDKERQLKDVAHPAPIEWPVNVDLWGRPPQFGDLTKVGQGSIEGVWQNIIDYNHAVLM
jgi:hypothetical protein